jgi:hypothetical protein
MTERQRYQAPPRHGQAAREKLKNHARLIDQHPGATG